MTYPSSIRPLRDNLATAPDTPVTALARRLIDGAQAFDLAKARDLGVNFKLKGVARDQDNPPYIDHDSILGAPWADNAANPLLQGEAWNRGRRATNTGTLYALDADGHPLNPYATTGLRGRGVLGQFGPNHAVDNGVLVLKADEQGVPTLYALGILRKFDGNAPAFAGGFAKYKKNEAGEFLFDHVAVVQTQMEEFFEEMISGSITLLPEYEDRLEPAIAAEIGGRMKGRNGQPLAEAHIAEIREQVETGLKMQQVADKDPGFLQRLRDVIANGRSCFAGPVLNDNRSTDNAWIETRLSWFLMDEDTWAGIRGDAPAFDYQLAAGDDASGVVLHRLDDKLVRSAFASHGPMFAFMAASFLLHAQEKGLEIDPDVRAQIEKIADFLDTAAPQIQPYPAPKLAP